MNNLFGRVDADNNIIEYPVYRQHIINRNHPFEWYKECVIENKPNTPKFHVAVEKLEVRGNKIYITYEVKSVSLENLIATIQNTPVQGKPLGERFINDIDQDTANRLIQLVDDYIEDKLSALAASAGYKDSDRIVGYANSTNPKFASEANKFIQLRDRIWLDMPIYLQGVLIGTTKLPNSTADIDAILPAFTLE